MDANGCRYVTRYLERFLDQGARAQIDLEQVSAHVGECSACYSRMSTFFRSMELKESAYLKETLDELALAIYNLAKAIVRDRPDHPDDGTHNVRITEEGGGSASENVQAGVEMIADAEDYVGASKVGNTDLEELRQMLESAETAQKRKIDLSLKLFQQITSFPSRYLFKAWNWVGALHYQKGNLDEAEAAYLRALSDPEGARDVRAFAHCNLGWIFKQRGAIDQAIRAAQRSVILAEEDGKDPYFGWFAELYFRLIRNGQGDAGECKALLQRILGLPGGRSRLQADLETPGNAAVLRTFQSSPLAAELAQS